MNDRDRQRFLANAGNDNNSKIKEFKSAVDAAAISNSLSDLIKCRSGDRKNALHISAEMGCAEQLRYLLTALKSARLLQPEILNARIAENYTPLHLAALSGFECCAEILVSFGADYEATTSSNLTPLDVAISKGNKNKASCINFLKSVKNNPAKYPRAIVARNNPESPPPSTTTKPLVPFQRSKFGGEWRNAATRGGKTVLLKKGRAALEEPLLQKMKERDRSGEAKTRLHLMLEDVGRPSDALVFLFSLTLLEVMKSRPGAGAEYLWGALLALKALHGLHVVHGDVRPANFMICPEGMSTVVKIANFERAADLNINGTNPPNYSDRESDAFKFDYPWAPPELLRKKIKPGAPTPRDRSADVFSFGLVVRVAIDANYTYEDLVGARTAGRWRTTPFLTVKEVEPFVEWSAMLTEPPEMRADVDVRAKILFNCRDRMLDLDPRKRLTSLLLVNEVNAVADRKTSGEEAALCNFVAEKFDDMKHTVSAGMERVQNEVIDSRKQVLDQGAETQKEIRALSAALAKMHGKLIKSSASVESMLANVIATTASKDDLARHYDLLLAVKKAVEEHRDKVVSQTAAEEDIKKSHESIMQLLQELKSTVTISSEATAAAFSHASVEIKDVRAVLTSQLNTVSGQITSVLENQEFLRSALAAAFSNINGVLEQRLSSLARSDETYRAKLLEALSQLQEQNTVSTADIMRVLKSMNTSADQHGEVLRRLEDSMFLLGGSAEENKVIARFHAAEVMQQLKSISEGVAFVHSNVLSIHREVTEQGVIMRKMWEEVSSATPRLLIAVPATRPETPKSVTHAFTSMFTGLFQKKLRLFFVCPVTMRVARSGPPSPSGGPAGVGYKLKLPRVTLLKIAPVLIYSYYFLQFALANIPSLGVSLSDLPEELSLNNVEYLRALSDTLAKETKNKSDLSPEELESLKDIDADAVLNGCDGCLVPTPAMSKVLELSRQEVFTLMIKDLEPQKYYGDTVQQVAQAVNAGFNPRYTGLKIASSSEAGGGVEWVHETAVEKFKRYGPECLYRGGLVEG